MRRGLAACRDQRDQQADRAADLKESFVIHRSLQLPSGQGNFPPMHRVAKTADVGPHVIDLDQRWRGPGGLLKHSIAIDQRLFQPHR